MKLKILFMLFTVTISACGQSNNKISGETNSPPDGLPNGGLPEKTNEGNIALVYDGPGACVEDCAEASAQSAKLAGLTPKVVGPTALNQNSTPEQVAALFKGVRVWIQPGGYSIDAYAAMTEKLRSSLKAFIANGGGYVGFCAGALVTTSQIATSGTPGLGIFPGKMAHLNAPTARSDLGFSIERVTWMGSNKRYMYFEGGPYFYDLPDSVEVVSVYDYGSKINGARTTYGKGRVFIVGTHPEGPNWWWQGTGVTDPDGNDQHLAADMIKWATGL